MNVVNTPCRHYYYYKPIQAYPPLELRCWLQCIYAVHVASTVPVTTIFVCDNAELVWQHQPISVLA